MTATINWTRPKLAQFKKVYADAVGKGMDRFVFEGHDILVSYAKYLIDYLDNQFKNK